MTSLVAEAARRSRVCWLSYGGTQDGADADDRLVWHVWHDEAVVVLSGDEGQSLPGLDRATAASVTFRAKDARTALVRCECTVEPVPRGTPAWTEHAKALLGVRLNLGDPAGALARWEQEATIVRLTPAPPSA